MTVLVPAATRDPRRRRRTSGLAIAILCLTMMLVSSGPAGDHTGAALRQDAIVGIWIFKDGGMAIFRPDGSYLEQRDSYLPIYGRWVRHGSRVEADWCARCGKAPNHHDRTVRLVNDRHFVMTMGTESSTSTAYKAG